ncbi:3-oxoacyl-ACP reductase FabG [Candidatus Aerophobetes bacterium]|uniref:3-oxoacyl-ACP reductase FabG n=1 Tax=Aerophobetes bacterium TaxID=2030807 RepID=A0A523W6Z5_UNCAE|nr:MAG: 3-oxoacyl-ACP reductase FabG [Candidatus Aerophobetes bacterium]
MRLKDKTALITGGARGIGGTTAFLFAKEGAKVGILDIREEGLRKIKDQAKKKGIALRTFVGDVSKKDQIESVMQEFVQEFGRIDVLVNNAGIAISRPFLEKTVEDWKKTLEVNLIGIFVCSQAAARYMLEQKSGKIINISSIRGIDHCGREGIMDYSASKAAVISLTKTMAKELAPHVNVNTVAPGHTNTEMIKSLPEEIRKNMIEGSYLKRLAKPQEIAKAILFLASNDADFITGQLLLVDGGFSLK